MKNIKDYPVNWGDVILENFSAEQIKQYRHFDKIPRLIFRLVKDENEMMKYTEYCELFKLAICKPTYKE